MQIFRVVLRVVFKSRMSSIRNIVTQLCSEKHIFAPLKIVLGSQFPLSLVPYRLFKRLFNRFAEKCSVTP